LLDVFSNVRSVLKCLLQLEKGVWKFRWDSLGPGVVIYGHIDGKVYITNFISQEIRTLAFRIVLLKNIVVFRDSLVLVLLRWITRIRRPTSLDYGQYLI
jgi:hypothetical protein